MFATIYETEGLEHHMAVERAHVSQREALKQESYIQIKEKGPVPLPTLCNFDNFHFYFFISEYLWEIGC